MLDLPELDGVTHRQVRVGGVSLHVAEAGSGPPLLLQHGWPQHWWAWHRVIGPLAERHRVVCPDLRGFGWSEAPPSGYEKEQLASDLLGVMDALELERVGLVGHDWGGWVAFLAALRAPERFEGLLALSIAHPWPAPGPPDPRALARLWYQAVIGMPVAGARLVSRPGVTRRMLGRSTEGAWSERDRELYVTALAAGGAAAASSRLYRTFLTRELLPVARGRYRDRTLAIPTRLVVGRQDPVIKEDMLGGFEDNAPQMSVELVEGGHFLPEQHPEVVLEHARAMFGPPGPAGSSR